MRDFLDRYGVPLGVVAALAVVVALLPGNADRQEVATGQFDPASAAGRVAGGGFAPDGSPLPVDGGSVAGPDGTLTGPTGGVSGGPAAGAAASDAAAATAAGGLPATCRADRRQKGVSRYMPPCQAVFRGDNGGATARGVTKDKIVVVRFLLPIDPATRAILEGYKLSDTEAGVKRSYDGLGRYFNQHYDTYGREVVFVDYQASGTAENEEAMKADALKIANDIKAFAVIEGNPAAVIPTVLARELAARGVICVCTTSLSSEFYSDNPPYIFTSLPSMNDYAFHLAEYIGKRLKGKNAEWAGDDQTAGQRYRQTPRKFGLIYVEGARGKVDPELRRARDIIAAELAKYGVELAASVGFLYDPGRNQQDMTTMIATLKNAGVTTVMGMWDPLSPVLITQEATRQQWFPEWLMTGAALSDTTTGGRLYDRAQWSNAFGISPLWVTWVDVKKSAGYREFHHGAPGSRPGDEGVLVNIYRAYFQILFTGIQLAGPRLTPDTFAQGIFRYPPTGGTAAAPLVFANRQYPTLIKDFTEVFFAADVSGPDERGDTGLGMVLKVDGGKRYRAGQWPTSNPKVFVNEGAIAVSDNPQGGLDPDHEQDGHTHKEKCLSCV